MNVYRSACFLCVTNVVDDEDDGNDVEQHVTRTADVSTYLSYKFDMQRGVGFLVWLEDANRHCVFVDTNCTTLC